LNREDERKGRICLLGLNNAIKDSSPDYMSKNDFMLLGTF